MNKLIIFQCAIMIFVIFLISSCTYHHTLNKQTPKIIAGTYESFDAFCGSKVELTEDYRFRVWWWSDVGGYHEEPSSVGRWVFTNKENLICLFSDNIPQKPISSYDSTLNFYTIKVCFNDTANNDMLSWINVDIVCADTFAGLHPDSLGFVYWKGPTPLEIRVYHFSSRSSFYFSDSTKSIHDINMKRNEWLGKGLITIGLPIHNFIEFFLYDDFPYENGDLYYLYDNTLYSLGALGMKKIH